MTDKIKAKIMALLAKANGTDNEHEAEAFMAKVHELLGQYQLDIADLVDAGDPVVQHVGMTYAETGHAWRWKLYCAVGGLYGCKPVLCPTHCVSSPSGKPVWHYRVELVGRESSTITVDLMYPWIAQQVRQHGKELSKVTGMSEQGQAKRVAAALISRIWALARQNEAAAPQTAAGRNALVVMDQVEAKFNELYPALTMGRKSRYVTDRLSEAAANSIGLHRQTPGKSQLKPDAS